MWGYEPSTIFEAKDGAFAPALAEDMMRIEIWLHLQVELELTINNKIKRQVEVLPGAWLFSDLEFEVDWKSRFRFCIPW